MEAAATPAAPRRSGWVTLAGILFIIAGGFNAIVGIATLGVSLGGTDSTVLGDVTGPIQNLEAIGVIVVCVAALQLIAGIGILQRRSGAQVLGLILAAIGILVHFAYYRYYDGWAWTSIFWSLLIIFILALRNEEFV